MPEYLAPGVYVEEVSFRQKSIEGVSTSTAGFVGPTRFGPIDGPPPLLTSFLDFERIFGGIDQLDFGAPVVNHVAHAVRAFFENGGSRLYVSRAFDPGDPVPGQDAAWRHHALKAVGGSPADLTLRARYPGEAGNFQVLVDIRVGPNIFLVGGGLGRLSGALGGDVLLVRDTASPLQAELSPPGAGLNWLSRAFDEANQVDTFRLRTPGVAEGASPLVTALGDGTDARIVTANVTISGLGRFTSDQFWEGLGFAPMAAPGDRPSILTVFAAVPANRSAALTVPLVVDAQLNDPVDVLEALTTPALLPLSPPSDTALELLERLASPPPGTSPRVQFSIRLEGGADGNQPDVAAYEGEDADGIKSGLVAFEDVDDISILAAPGSSDLDVVGNASVARTVQGLVISHCERMRYRIGVLDPLRGSSVGDVREDRGLIDSKHAALYYPWVTILDPLTEQEIKLPPSGFICGIYARNDVERGVHKSPANEIVRLAIDFEFRLNKAQQDVLNPEGVNCLRLLEGRGFRVWGARTISSDPEWKYVAVRRYFNFLEHSIDRGTQWAVFEPNGPILWENVRRTVDDFLFSEWMSGHLLGETPAQAYFVRCDLSTMNQNDLDNGRLVCLIGVSPLRPAEFVVFRIGQKTLDSPA
jgi:phage tail sheath protein FI